jgi:hypothetical protein
MLTVKLEYINALSKGNKLNQSYCSFYEYKNFS